MKQYKTLEQYNENHISKILADKYLDFINNYLTVEKFAEHNDISITCAKHLLEAGEIAHEDNVRFIKSLEGI